MGSSSASGSRRRKGVEHDGFAGGRSACTSHCRGFALVALVASRYLDMASAGARQKRS